MLKQDFISIKSYNKYNYFVKESNKLLLMNDSWEANQHIRMISEGSCDTEPWSNDAENSALISGINNILKCIKTEKLSHFNL